jgi:hypothetical protein
VERSTLVASLLTFRHEARSGVLEVRAEGVRTFLYLLRGALVFAEEESIGETLGRLLVRQKKLTQEQYVQIIERMTEGIFDNEQLRFGEVAVELGFLSAEEVERALADQVRWKIIRTLQREEHEFHFADSSGQVEAVLKIPLALEPLILEACRWIPDERKLYTLGLVSPDRALTLREPPNIVAQRYQTTPDERTFLQHLDGRKRMPELLVLAKDTDTDVPALLTALVVSKGIAYAKEPERAAPAPAATGASPPPAPPAPQPAAAPVASPSPPAVAKAAPAPTPVHRGFVPTPQQFVPFRGPAPDTKTEKDAAKEKADRALALLLHNRPGGAKTRSGTIAAVAAVVWQTPKPPSDHEARLLAEQSFQRGRKYLFQGQVKLAHAELEKAHQLQPASIEYELHAMWAAFVIGALPADAGRAKLKAASGAAVKNDPNSAFGYYVMGEMALLEKNESTARRAFAHSVKLDSNNTDAQRRLRLLAKK